MAINGLLVAACLSDEIDPGEPSAIAELLESYSSRSSVPEANLASAVARLLKGGGDGVLGFRLEDKLYAAPVRAEPKPLLMPVSKPRDVIAKPGGFLPCKRLAIYAHSAPARGPDRRTLDAFVDVLGDVFGVKGENLLTSIRVSPTSEVLVARGDLLREAARRLGVAKLLYMSSTLVTAQRIEPAPLVLVLNACRGRQVGRVDNLAVIDCGVPTTASTIVSLDEGFSDVLTALVTCKASLSMGRVIESIDVARRYRDMVEYCGELLSKLCRFVGDELVTRLVVHPGDVLRTAYEVARCMDYQTALRIFEAVYTKVCEGAEENLLAGVREALYRLEEGVAADLLAPLHATAVMLDVVLGRQPHQLRRKLPEDKRGVVDAARLLGVYLGSHLALRRSMASKNKLEVYKRLVESVCRDGYGTLGFVAAAWRYVEKSKELRNTIYDYAVQALRSGEHLSACLLALPLIAKNPRDTLLASLLCASRGERRKCEPRSLSRDDLDKIKHMVEAYMVDSRRLYRSIREAHRMLLGEMLKRIELEGVEDKEDVIDSMLSLLAAGCPFAFLLVSRLGGITVPVTEAKKRLLKKPESKSRAP